eukprot:c8259_g1_i1 orf=1-252(-)
MLLLPSLNKSPLVLSALILVAFYLELANWKSFPLPEKTMTPTSASHNTDKSCAFFNSPPWRFENVTCLVVTFSILLIFIFLRTI